MTPDEVPESYLRAVAHVESGGNDQARARSSTALGRYQFIDSTWNALRARYPALRLTAGGRTDRAQADRAMRRFTADNASTLQAGLGRALTNGDLYLAHFAGAGGALKILRAGLQSDVATVLGQRACQANNFMACWTCGQLRAWAERKMETALAAAGGP